MSDVLNEEVILSVSPRVAVQHFLTTVQLCRQMVNCVAQRHSF